MGLALDRNLPIKHGPLILQRDEEPVHRFRSRSIGELNDTRAGRHTRADAEIVANDRDHIPPPVAQNGDALAVLLRHEP